MRSQLNNTYRLIFSAGFSAALTSSGISLLVLSGLNYFFPGYNDDDSPSWVKPFYWLTTIVSAITFSYIIYKIRQDTSDEVDREISYYNLVSINGKTSQNDSEINPLIPKKNNCIKKLGVGFLGSLSSLALLLAFLFIARNDAEKSYNYSNSTVTWGLFGAAGGVGILSLFTGILLCYCHRKKEINYNQWGSMHYFHEKEQVQEAHDFPGLEA